MILIGDGSKLLLNIEKVKSITRAATENSNLPITVKIRKGWDENHVNAIEVAKAIEEAGASAITIHGRTRSEFYSGKADWDIIKKVKQNVKIPVIGNGDIKEPADAKKIFELTNCDGIMISRGALGNPWIFKQVQNYLNGKEIRKISKEEKLKIIIEHIELETKEKGELTGVREMRKHLAFYIKGTENASEIRNKINFIDDKNKLEEVLTDYFTNIEANHNI